jgi:hypothetical protein
MAKKSGLSVEDVADLRAQLDEGSQPMVWFTAAAVGMEEGRSAKLLAVTDPPEGDFIQVRPTGSKDEMSFSLAELTLEKPPPRKKPAPAPPAAPPEPPRETEVIHPYVPEAPVKPAAPKPKPAPAPVAEQAPPPKPAPRKPSPKSVVPEVTVTLVTTGEGEWSVEVLQGTRRAVKPTPVPPAAVAQAAKLLTPEVSEIVEGVLNAARDRQLARVEQLRAELEAAQKALDDLGA